MTEKMKPSGIAWIGDIPSEWKTTKIKYCVQTIGSGTTPDSGNPSYYDDGIFPWIQSGDLYGKSVILETEKRLTKAAIIDFPVLSWYENDFVVVAMYGASVGNVAISKIAGYTNQACCVIKTRKDCDLRYLYYYLSAAQEDMLQKAFGGTQPNISQVIIKNLSFLNVPAKEQTKISNFLDIKCTEIDGVIADIEKQLEALQKYKKSLITEAVTKGLDWTVPMKDSGVEWIGDIPTKWDCKKLKYIISEPLQYGANEVGYDYSDDYPRYIRITDITEENTLKEDGKLSLHPDVATPYILKDGDILFARSGATVGKTFFYSMKYGCAAFAGYLIRARINSNMALPRFVYYSTLGIGYENWKNTVFTQATIQNIGADKYAQFFVTLPELSEQHSIVEYLDEKCVKIDDVIKIKQKQLYTMQQHKKSLIYEYVTGKKRVIEVK